MMTFSTALFFVEAVMLFPCCLENGVSTCYLCIEVFILVSSVCSCVGVFDPL